MTAQNNSTQPRRRKEAAGFLHDANARNDQKLLRLRAAGGWAYYGLYFACLEVMREDSEYAIQADAVMAVALSLNERATDFQTFLDLAVNVGLFIRDQNGSIRSRSLLERMERYEKALEQRKEAGRLSAERRAQRAFNDRSTNAATAVNESLNGPNKNKNQNNNKNQNQNNNSKDRKRARADKYRVFAETDFDFPPRWGDQARAALARWVEYKARSGHPCLIDSYALQVRQFETDPRRYVQLVDRAIAKGWRGLNEELVLGQESQSEKQIKTHLELIAKLEAEERDAN
jgi:hypothetical protein